MHISNTPQQRTLKAKYGTAGILLQMLEYNQSWKSSLFDFSNLCSKYADGPIKARPPKKGADPTQE